MQSPYIPCPHKKDWMFWTAVPKPNWVPIHLLWIRFPSSAQLPNVLSHKDSTNKYIEISAKKLTTVLVRKQVDYKLILTVTVIDLVAGWREDAVLWRDQGFLNVLFWTVFKNQYWKTIFKIYKNICTNCTEYHKFLFHHEFMSLSEVDIFECSLHVPEVTASSLQVRKSIWNTEVPQHPPNAILPKFFLTHLLISCMDMHDMVWQLVYFQLSLLFSQSMHIFFKIECESFSES